MINATGERYLPWQGGVIQAEHLHRYLFARQFCRGKRVLDIACGEGYGAKMLAAVAGHVWGVDLDPAAIEHARANYRENNLTFIPGSITAIPLETASAEVVVSFETIEHLAEHEQALSEIRRVMKDDGFLIMSSPDKLHYSDRTGYCNEFHVRELYKDEFISLITRYFPLHHLYSQQFISGSVIAAEGEAGKTGNVFYRKENNDPGTAVSETSLMPSATYHILVAGLQPLPLAGNSLFIVSNPLEEENRKLSANLEQLLHSWSFRTGSTLLAPLRWLRNRFS